MSSHKSSFVILSPAVLVFLSWLVMSLITFVSYLNIDNLELLRGYLRIHGLDFNYPVFGFFWLALSLSVFLITSFLLRSNSLYSQVEQPTKVDFSQSIKIATILQVVFFVVTAIWIGITASKVGGLNILVILVQEEVNTARSILLENKLFTGMRLFYAGFVGTGTFSAVALAYHLRTRELSPSDYKKSIIIFVSSIILLAILPIVLSQRILLFNLLIAAYVAAAFTYGRLLWVKYIPIAVGLLFLVWMGREVVTAGQFTDVSPVELAFQRLLFYFVNDFWNSVHPLGVDDIPHSYGLHSFQFLLYFTQTHGFVESMMAETIDALGKLRGGGEFPIFTAPYIDFGVFGLIFIVFIAFIFKLLYLKAHDNIRYVPVYGLVAATLVFCTHNAYYTNQEFWFNLIVVVFLATRLRSIA